MGLEDVPFGDVFVEARQVRLCARTVPHVPVYIETHHHPPKAEVARLGLVDRHEHVSRRPAKVDQHRERHVGRLGHLLPPKAHGPLGVAEVLEGDHLVEHLRAQGLFRRRLLAVLQVLRVLARGDGQAVPHGHPLELVTLPQVTADHLTRSDLPPDVHRRQETASVPLDRQDPVLRVHVNAHETRFRLLLWLRLLMLLLFALLFLLLLSLTLCRVEDIWCNILVVSEYVDLQVAFEKHCGTVRTRSPSLGGS